MSTAHSEGTARVTRLDPQTETAVSTVQQYLRTSHSHLVQSQSVLTEVLAFDDDGFWEFLDPVLRDDVSITCQEVSDLMDRLGQIQSALRQ